MTLYEITNGMTGESYVRAYAWAPDEATALELYRARHGEDGGRLHARPLFVAGPHPFVTDICDYGWPESLEG